MTSPRRAATEQVEVTTQPGEEPRRAAGAAALRPLVRKAVAPLAVVGVMVAATVLTFVPMDQGTSVADPLHQAEVDMGVSRSRERQPIPDLPVGAPSPTMVSSIDAPSSSVAPGATPTTATASPTPSPDEVAPSLPPTPDAAAAPASPDAGVDAAPSTSAPAASAAPEPDATPEAPDWSVLGAEAGDVWSTASVNVRSGPGTEHEVLTTLRRGTEVTATETTADGWQQVSISGEAGWVKGTYLSDEEPEETGINTSACTSVSGSTSGLTANAVQVRNAVCNAFPGVSSIGGYRAGGGSYHSAGRAVDVMISGEAGWEVARWARANASQLGIIEVIYSQQIWTSQRSGDGWRWMSDRGSSSANHYDHVHISVR